MGEAGETAKKFRWQDAALPIFAAAAVLALLFALPTPLMDLLLSFNLAISVVIFVAVFFVHFTFNYVFSLSTVKRQDRGHTLP